MFYEFRLEDRVPEQHLLRRINAVIAAVLTSLHKDLAPYYSSMDRPSIDPGLMIRMLIVEGIGGGKLIIKALRFDMEFV